MADDHDMVVNTLLAEGFEYQKLQDVKAALGINPIVAFEKQRLNMIASLV